MYRWQTLLLIAVIVVGTSIASAVFNGIDGWTVFSAFVVGALCAQSFYTRLADQYRKIIDGIVRGKLEIIIEEITEDADEAPVDRPA